MKLIRFLLLSAFIMPLAFGCGEKETPDPKSNFKDGPFADKALVIKWDGNTIEFNQSGTYLARIDRLYLNSTEEAGIASTKAESMEVFSGAFTVNGNAYTLNGFGSLNITSPQTLPSGQTTGNIELRPSGAPSIQIPVSFYGPASDMVLDMTPCRDWIPEKSRITLHKSGSPDVSSDFTGLNISDIEKFLIDNGIHIANPLESGYSVTKFSLFRFGMLSVHFANNARYDAVLSGLFANGAGSLNINGVSDLALDMLEGGLKLEYSGNYCLATIASVFKESNGKSHNITLLVTLK